jgi:arylsulfatase A-like enzyme
MAWTSLAGVGRRGSVKTRTALPLAFVLAVACDGPSDRLSVRRRFVDLAEVDGEGRGRLEGAVLRSRGEAVAREIAVHGDRRAGISLDTPGRLVFRSDALPLPELRFGLAVRPPDAGVSLQVIVNRAVVLQESWTEERGWVERRVSLSRFAGEPLEIELSFEGADATVLLAHPEVLGRAEEDRPNVIVYVVDCLRADHVGAYGYELETTPEIDRLAEDGVLLEDLNSCASWTKPSTACLFTSSLPTFHQARTVDDALPRARTTLAEVFRQEGYVTAAWVANPVIDPRVFFFNQGFDRWVDVRSFEERSRRAHLHDTNPDAAQITEAVLPWLEAHGRDRFFLYLHSLDLHYPYQARPPFDSRFLSAESAGLDRDREQYDAELAYNDREIGKLVSRLKELDLYDDTLVFVTADHGEEFGEHGASRHGKTLYQQVLHIPGILKLPGSRLGGRRAKVLASNIDVAPTLLEVAGIEIPEEFQGRSLLDVLEKGGARTERRAVAELLAPNVVAYSMRDERFKHIKVLVPELAEMIFDLERDPEETTNILPSAPAEGAALVSYLERFVQLGQHGAHLSIRGEGNGAAVRVEIGTEAEIASAFRFAISTGDVLTLASDRKGLTLTFAADGKARHLVVQTEPAGADLSLVVTADGRTLSQSSLKMQDVAVSVAEAERLLHEPESPVRVWYLAPGSGRHRVELDEETLNVLRALGYVQ